MQFDIYKKLSNYHIYLKISITINPNRQRVLYYSQYVILTIHDKVVNNFIR